MATACSSSSSSSSPRLLLAVLFLLVLGHAVRSFSIDQNHGVPRSNTQTAISRSRFFETATIASLELITTTTTSSPLVAGAFEGGVGGLGKTKPETGVEFLEGSVPIQNAAGIVSAELVVTTNNNKKLPVRVEFEAPWPLLASTSGLEARDLQASESAFLQVVTNAALPTSPKAMKELLLSSVFTQQGKFSAYGSPMDVKVQSWPSSSSTDDDSNNLLYRVSFTTLTPGLRESDRQVLVNCQSVESGSSTTLVLLIVGTTAQRFKSQQAVLEQVAKSFQAFEAPPRLLLRS